MADIRDIIKGIKVGGASPFSNLEADVWSAIPGWIPTGAPSLDLAIGGYKPGFVGGIPMGRVSVVVGPESAGKSALLDHIIMNFIKIYGGVCLLADAEHAHTPSRMEEIGIDMSSVFFIEKPLSSDTKKGDSNDLDFTLEEFFSITEKTFREIRKEDKDTPILVALDSLAVTPTNAQRSAIFDEGQEAYQDVKMNVMLDKAKIMSSFFGPFSSSITQNNATLVIVNQLRQKPGTMFGDPHYSPGGETLKYMASLIINLRKDEMIKPEKDPMRKHFSNFPVGIKVKYTTQKNKISSPMRSGTFNLFFDDRGIDPISTIVDFLLESKYHEFDGRFEKAGSWYSWKGERLGQGRESMIKALFNDEVLFDDIKGSLFEEAIDNE